MNRDKSSLIFHHPISEIVVFPTRSDQNILYSREIFPSFWPALLEVDKILHFHHLETEVEDVAIKLENYRFAPTSKIINKILLFHKSIPDEPYPQDFHVATESLSSGAPPEIVATVTVHSRCWKFIVRIVRSHPIRTCTEQINYEELLGQL